jgi:dethiobiotin synthetase
VTDHGELSITHSMSRIVFITGTDTGVGKTLLTGLLLHHLRQRGCHALGMKPFCSGSRADVEFLAAVQQRELTLDEINPFFFAKPLAPLVAAREQRVAIKLPAVLRQISNVAKRCEWLLIEGIGGVMVPLGNGFSVLDLIAALSCSTVVVSRNKLGTINHTMLTVDAMQHAGIKRLKAVLMASKERDFYADWNGHILSELLAPAPVIPIPFLGRNPARFPALRRSEKKVKKTLARILS